MGRVDAPAVVPSFWHYQSKAWSPVSLFWYKGGNKGHSELLCQPLALPLAACTHLLPVYQGHNGASVPGRLWDHPHKPAGPYQAPLGTTGPLVVTRGTCLLLFIFLTWVIDLLLISCIPCPQPCLHHCTPRARAQCLHHQPGLTE